MRKVLPRNKKLEMSKQMIVKKTFARVEKEIVLKEEEEVDARQKQE